MHHETRQAQRISRLIALIFRNIIAPFYPPDPYQVTDFRTDRLFQIGDPSIRSCAITFAPQTISSIRCHQIVRMPWKDSLAVTLMILTAVAVLNAMERALSWGTKL